MGCEYVAGLPEPLDEDIDEAQFVPVEEVDRFIPGRVPEEVKNYLMDFAGSI